MRLWHQEMIPLLPRQQLLGQHRECCALRGKGWMKKHATIDYIFNYKKEQLVAYHMLIIKEMKNRGYNVTKDWEEFEYQGKNLDKSTVMNKKTIKQLIAANKNIYDEHNKNYYIECVENLANKGIFISKQNNT